MSEAAGDLIRGALTVDPGARFTVTMIYDHRWTCGQAGFGARGEGLIPSALPSASRPISCAVPITDEPLESFARELLSMLDKQIGAASADSAAGTL